MALEVAENSISLVGLDRTDIEVTLVRVNGGVG